MIKIASKIYGRLLKISGYALEIVTHDGSEHQAITGNLNFISVKRIGGKDGYWIDTSTGMVVVPVWFKCES